MTSKHKVFVYGTLRSQAGTKEPTHVLKGFDMYNYHNKFPYIVGGSKYGVVVGNILVVDDTGLDYLDRYEGVDSGFYERTTASVKSVDGDSEEKDVWVYVAGNVAPEKISSGDWVKETEND